MYFCPKGPTFSKISQQIMLKWDNSKQDKFSNYLILRESFSSLNFHIGLMNSFIFIDRRISPRTVKKVFFFGLKFAFQIE